MSRYTQRTSSSSLFLEIRTTSVSMMPALPTMPRPGSMMVSGIWLPKCLRSARKIDRRYVLEVLGRESATHVDHGQVDPALGAVAEHGGGHRQRAVPRLHLALLRADMERDAVGLQAEALGEVEHVDRHFRIAAELARQRPFGAGAVIENAAEHLGAGGGAGDLLDLGGAVDREQANAEREGARDIALLLDRIAIGDALRGRTGIERHLDLGDRGAVEARAHR